LFGFALPALLTLIAIACLVLTAQADVVGPH
jgi:hypothetical protein